MEWLATSDGTQTEVQGSQEHLVNRPLTCKEVVLVVHKRGVTFNVTAMFDVVVTGGQEALK